MSEKHETSDENVETAVKFLNVVAGQRHPEQHLRSYLRKKQGLTNEQVEEAFQKHRSQQNINKNILGKQQTTDQTVGIEKTVKPLVANCWSSDKEVETAVEFLIGAFENDKMNSEQKLRSYLANRRGLSIKQIDEAFRMYRIRQEVKEKSLTNREEKVDETGGANCKSADWKIETAVEFLVEVGQREEEYPEQKLKQYLSKKRGLNKTQIDTAFRIYRIRQNEKEKPLVNTDEKSKQEVFTIEDRDAKVITNAEEAVDKGNIGVRDTEKEAKETSVVTSADGPLAKTETGFNEPSGKFRSWSADQVASWVEWLESGKFKSHAKHFQANHVDGALLSVLNDDELNHFLAEDLSIQNADVRTELAYAIRSKTKYLLDAGKQPKLEEYKETTEQSLDEIYVSLKSSGRAE